MLKKLINCFYNHFKDTPKRLKIVCDWDEVIQSLEPFALYLALKEEKQIPSELEKLSGVENFSQFFEFFWQQKLIDYSAYGSKLFINFPAQAAKKNHPEFYQQAPFLSLAKELLRLVKENKAEVIFLSAYDKSIFTDGDPRKKRIFKETFGKYPNCSLSLIGFKWGEKQKTKGQWVKENVPGCDIMLDDNPNILDNARRENPNLTVCAPDYPAVKHHDKVLLFKTSISNLKKEDF